jgi:hypothetical protein
MDERPGDKAALLSLLLRHKVSRRSFLFCPHAPSADLMPLKCWAAVAPSRRAYD